ncbi:tetratricopeptide repeat protein [uncultured Succinivibrio sp.]|uniref:tetratricopeptide repeat protein n=1 Tax=uncultured Succinivibrio sp. TaxID=540749 RepID=UPI0025DA8221|nr:tetratricopeptide repeat protein [uncultured Succinivibrio sp.]
MKFTNKKRKSAPLLSKTTIALLTAGAVGAVYVLSPTSTNLEKKISDTSSPEVSLNYLQELEKLNPDDPMIPYLKAKLLYEKGNYNDVIELLAPEIKEDPDHRALDTFILYLKTKVALAGTIDNQSKDKTLSEVNAELNALLNRNFTTEQLKEIVKICYQIPDVEKAYIYICKIENPDYETMNEIYSLALQTGHYDKAIEFKKNLFLNEESKENYETLFSLYLQAFDKDMFSAFLKEYGGKLKDDSDFIKAEIDTATKLGLYEETFGLIEHLCEKEPSFENKMVLAENCVSRKDLDRAVSIFEELHESDITPEDKKREITVRLHDIYKWKGDLEGSQRMSYELLESDPSQAEVLSGVEESRSLSDLEGMDNFYKKAFESGYLSSEQYDDFVDVVEKAEGSKEALSMVNKLLEDNSGNSTLISHKIRLESYFNEYKKVTLAFEKLIEHRKPTAKEAMYAANAYVMQGNDKKALEALTAVDKWEEQNDEYMVMVSSLSWTCDDDNLASLSQNVLLDRNSMEADSYKLLNSIEITPDNIDKLIGYYEAKRDFTIMSELLSHSAVKNDYALMQRLLDVIKKLDESCYASTDVLSYRATLAMHNRDFKEAKRIYEKQLNSNPSSLEAIDGLCNIALMRGDKKEADALYHKYKKMFASNPAAWQMAAYLASSLGYGMEAKAWYEQYLSNAASPSAVDLLSYAEVLSDLGYSDKAYRIRKYVVDTKTEELLKLNDSNVTLASLVSTFISKSVGEDIIRNELKSSESSALGIQLMTSLLERNDIKSAIYFKKRSSLANVVLSDSQELILAVRTKDKEKIKDLLERGVGIRESEKYDALEKISKRLEAYQLAKNTVGVSPYKDVNKALRGQMAANNQSLSRSVMAVIHSQPLWGLQSYAAYYHAPYSLGQFGVATIYQHSKAPDAMAISKLKSEKRIIGKISYEQEKYEVAASADLADGAADDRLGLKIDYLFKLDERYAVSLSGALNQHSNVSHMMTVLGKDNYAELRLSASPWNREYFALTSRIHNYKTRYNENLGSGYDLEFMAMTPVFNSDPALYGYTSWLYQNNNPSDNALRDTNILNGSLNDASVQSLSSESFISKQYKHLAIGMTTSHGDPGIPGPSVPSPRFLFDFFTGYNFTEKKIDAGASAGVGISLFKAQDELFIKSSVQSADRQGNKSVSLTFGYSMVF